MPHGINSSQTRKSLKSDPALSSKAKTGDLSIGGCFLDVLNPSPEGTEIQVTIFRENTKFSGLGRVVFVFPNLGVGVVFTSLLPTEVTILEGWLAELKLGGGRAVITS